jgi:hypothetical protein
MKSAVWRKSAERYLLPRLPGVWHVSATLAHREPAEWVLTGVGMVSSQYGGHHWYELIAQPLFVPQPGWAPLGVRVGHGQPGGEQREDFDNVDAGEETLGWLADRLTEPGAEDGLETLARLGTLPGLAALDDERLADDPGNVNWWEVAAGLGVLLDEGERVVAAGRGADAAVAADGRAWVVAVWERARTIVDLYATDPTRAVEELSRRAERTRHLVVGG